MNKKIKFVEGFPHSFEDENSFSPDPNHLVILDVIFQASDHPEVVNIFTQYRQKYERHDVNSKCISSRKVQSHH